jgi:hypothetical protein
VTDGAGTIGGTPASSVRVEQALRASDCDLRWTIVTCRLPSPIALGPRPGGRAAPPPEHLRFPDRTRCRWRGGRVTIAA